MIVETMEDENRLRSEPEIRTITTDTTKIEMRPELRSLGPSHDADW